MSDAAFCRIVVILLAPVILGGLGCQTKDVNSSPNPTFEVSPRSLTLHNGESGQVAVNVNFNANLVVATDPPDTSRFFPEMSFQIQNPLTQGQNLLKITVLATAPPGRYDVDLTSTDPTGYVWRARVEVTVPDNYSVTLDPDTLRFPAGQAGQGEVLIHRTGFSGPIDFDVSINYLGINAYVLPARTSGDSGTVTVTVGGPGRYELDVAGATGDLAGGHTAAKHALLTVIAGQPEGIGVSVAPSYFGLTQGSSRDVDIEINRKGSTDPISLSLDALPGGYPPLEPYTFDPATILPGDSSSVLTMTGRGGTGGFTQIHLYASAPGSAAKVADLTLIEMPSSSNGDFLVCTGTVSVRVRAEVPRGGSCDVPVYILRPNGFTGNVELTTSGITTPGLSASFNPVGPNRATLRISTDVSTPIGLARFTVRGTSGGSTVDYLQELDTFDPEGSAHVSMVADDVAFPRGGGGWGNVTLERWNAGGSIEIAPYAAYIAGIAVQRTYTSGSTAAVRVDVDTWVPPGDYLIPLQATGPASTFAIMRVTVLE